MPLHKSRHTESQEKGKTPSELNSNQNKNDNNEQSPSIKQSNNSNTQSQDAGDRPGQGKAGGGQQAHKSGKGTAGSHTPDDQGAKASNQEGMGETGTQAGDRDIAKGKTGKSSDAKGSGSQSRTTEQSDAKKSESTRWQIRYAGRRGRAAIKMKSGRPILVKMARRLAAKGKGEAGKSPTGDGRQDSKSGQGERKGEGASGANPGGGTEQKVVMAKKVRHRITKPSMKNSTINMPTKQPIWSWNISRIN